MFKFSDYTGSFVYLFCIFLRRGEGSGFVLVFLLFVGRGWFRVGVFIWEFFWINVFVFVYVNLLWVLIGVDFMSKEL